MTEETEYEFQGLDSVEPTADGHKIIITTFAPDHSRKRIAIRADGIEPLIPFLLEAMLRAQKNRGDGPNHVRAMNVHSLSMIEPADDPQAVLLAARFERGGHPLVLLASKIAVVNFAMAVLERLSPTSLVPQENSKQRPH